ncbi:hypothetical protein VTJ04DRAFT_4317 [Mycothermus thermophilus]|uniref:uncharacterized protein n=1 Tax=Humicola insolens TaxID=85995 RepID=UPI0037446BF6
MRSLTGWMLEAFGDLRCLRIIGDGIDNPIVHLGRGISLTAFATPLNQHLHHPSMSPRQPGHSPGRYIETFFAFAQPPCTPCTSQPCNASCSPKQSNHWPSSPKFDSRNRSQSPKHEHEKRQLISKQENARQTKRTEPKIKRNSKRSIWSGFSFPFLPHRTLHQRFGVCGCVVADMYACPSLCLTMIVRVVSGGGGCPRFCRRSWKPLFRTGPGRCGSRSPPFVNPSLARCSVIVSTRGFVERDIPSSCVESQ